jgi:uncharacterized repeat protein (TIGR01451 family)
MRRLYLLAGLAIFGAIGLVGWATLGSAQQVVPPMGPPQPAAPLIEQIPEIPATPTKAKLPSGFASQREADQPKAPDTLPRNRPIPVKPQAGDDPLIEKIPTTDPAKSKDAGLLIPATPGQEPMKVVIQDEKAENVIPPMEQQHPRNIEAPISNSKQEPSVSLEWIGQAAVKVGNPVDYTLVVKNTSGGPVQKVTVQVRVPHPVNVLTAEPKAEGAEGVLMWDLGTFLPKQERRIQLKMMSPNRGDIACQAWVTFTGSSVMRMLVREPKLLVKVTMPKEILVGDAANIVMTVSNPGDHPAEKVKITANLGEGLESVRGNKLNYEIGTLAAGETRTLQFPFVSKLAGEQKCEAFAEADGGLKATDNSGLMVIQPRVDLEVVGPKRRYLDRKAVYGFKVTNPGNAPATNVFITDVVPAGFKFVQADNGGQHDFATNSVKWFIGEIAPGQSKEVKAEFLAVSMGDHVHKVIANASRGIKSEHEMKTIVEGLSAIEMEATATENPIEVGAETTFEIKVLNAGTGSETDVKLICTIPPQMKLKSATGPTKYDIVGNELIFQPMPKLTHRADCVYKVTVTATEVGDVRFKTAVTTSTMVDPLIKVVAVKVYEDK